MSTIGYAIFGTTKGLEVLSNGLFKELDIDGSLYLNTTSHTDLVLNETVLLIRRIPTNKANLENKDGILIALYEYAGQLVGNRPGFMGSAICFKDKIPNAEKLIQGLFFLFGKMKTYVDSDSKINTGSSNWDTNILPDPKGDFGLFSTQKLSFSPLENSTQNIVVPLNNLRNDAIGLLTHTCLNYSFHNTSHLYATTNENVLNKLLKNGFEKTSYLDLFNYNKSINILEKNQSVLRTEISKLNADVNAKDTQLKNLTNSINSNTLRLKALNLSINEIEHKEKGLKKQYEDKEKTLKEKLLPLQHQKRKIDDELFEKKEKLRVLERKIRTIEEDPNLAIYKKAVRDTVQVLDWEFKSKDQIAYYNSLATDIDRLKFFISEKKKEGTKKPKISLTKVLFFISFLLLLAVSNLFNYHYFDKQKKVDTAKKQIEKRTLENKKLEVEKTILKFKAFDIEIDSLKKHQEDTYNLLHKILKDSITEKDSLYQFAITNQWQYWELFYKDSMQINLLEKVYKKSLKDIGDLKDKDIDSLLSNPLDSSKQKISQNKFVLKYLERKRRNPYYVKIKHDDKIEFSKKKIKTLKGGLKAYKNFDNDFFRDVDPKIDKDQKLSEAYFIWLVKKCNQLDENNLKQLKDLVNETKISIELPSVK